MKKIWIAFVLIIAMTGCGGKETTEKPEETTEPIISTLTLIGHASMKIVTKTGKVIYIDPSYQGNYDDPADYILITHGHSDHNHPKMPTSKESTVLITWKEALDKDGYHTFDYGDIKIEAVMASNSNHLVSECVGYLITFDGITVYHAGDTSYVSQMEELAKRTIDYAFYPIDGEYNMDAKAATIVANLVGAKNNCCMHVYVNDKSLYNSRMRAFTPENKLDVYYGKIITL